MTDLSIYHNLDRVYSTSIIMIINSRFRDTVQFPNTWEYGINMGVLINSIAEITLLQFVTDVFVPGSQLMYISMNPFKAKTYTPGYPQQNILFTIPIRTPPSFYFDYELEYKDIQTVFFVKDDKPNTQEIYLRFFDDIGNPLTTLPEHSIKFVFKCFA